MQAGINKQPSLSLFLKKYLAIDQEMSICNSYTEPDSKPLANKKESSLTGIKGDKEVAHWREMLGTLFLLGIAFQTLSYSCRHLPKIVKTGDNMLATDVER